MKSKGIANINRIHPLETLTVRTKYYDNPTIVDIFHTEPKRWAYWWSWRESQRIIKTSMIHPLGIMNVCSRFYGKISKSCWEERQRRPLPTTDRSHNYYGCVNMVFWGLVITTYSFFFLGEQSSWDCMFHLFPRKTLHTQFFCLFVIIDINRQGEACLKVVTTYLQGRKYLDWLLLHCYVGILGGKMRMSPQKKYCVNMFSLSWCSTPLLSYWMCLLKIKHN